MLRLTITSLWHGRPCTQRERVFLTFSAAGPNLRVIVDATFHGDPRPEAPVGSTPKLWEHEVVELFIAGPGQRYTEIELGPYGHFLVLQLDGERNIVTQGRAIRFRTAIARDTWTGTALIPWKLLPPGPHRMNATAIHGGGRRRHLSWQPLPGRPPDFHQLDCFAPVVLPGAPEPPTTDS